MTQKKDNFAHSSRI